MALCSECKKEIPENVKTCPECGAELNTTKTNKAKKVIITCLIIIGIFLVIAFLIVKFTDFGFKDALIAEGIGGIILFAKIMDHNPDGKRYLYQLSCIINGKVIEERVWADSEYEAKNIIYAKYQGQDIKNIIVLRIISKRN